MDQSHSFLYSPTVECDLCFFCFFALLPAAVLAGLTILTDKLRNVAVANVTYRIDIALLIGVVIGLIWGFSAGVHGFFTCPDL